MGIWITEDVEIIPDHVKKLCEEIFLTEGFDNCEVVLTPACGKGENYFSDVKRLTANKNNVKFNLIAKMALTQEYSRIISFAPYLFHNENAIYKNLFPKFDEIQNKAGIQQDERLRYAKLYGSADKPTEVIILEDLNESGYMHLEKDVDYDNCEILITLKELAKYHALSFALKHKDESFYNEFKNNLLNFWNLEYNMAAIMGLYKTIQEGTALYFDDEKQKHYLRESIIKLPEIGQQFYDNDIKSKYSVISVGLKYRHKPMYQFKDGKPSKVIFLDFQQASISSPAVDVHFYICNSTEYEARRKHYEEWLDYYFEQLQRFLLNHGLSLDVYPRTEFNKDSKNVSKYVFGISVLFASYFAREVEIQIQNGICVEHPEEKYKKTVLGLMNSMIELGYVD